MIVSPMTDGRKNSDYQHNYKYDNRKTNMDYIANVKIRADNKLIYNQNLSPELAENPLLKFSYKDIKASILTLEYTDNNGTIKIYDTKVKEHNTSKEMPPPIKLIIHPKRYPNKIKSVQKLFGSITLIEDGIQLIAPRLAENGGFVPISIHSNIKFKSIALFVKSKNTNSCKSDTTTIKKDNPFYLVSQWFSTPYSIANFDVRVTMKAGGEGEVLVVLEAENGKFYTSKKEVDVSLAGGRE
jgi:predicted secreted protein